MITFLLITGLVISLGINIAAYKLIRILLKKQEVYEQWIREFKTDIETLLEQMRAIDKQGVFASSVNDKGLFESDDQVGQIFKQLTDLVEQLNEKIQ